MFMFCVSWDEKPKRIVFVLKVGFAVSYITLPTNTIIESDEMNVVIIVLW